MRWVTMITAVLMLGVVRVVPAAAQVVGVNDELARVLIEVDLAKAVIIVGGLLGLGFLGMSFRDSQLARRETREARIARDKADEAERTARALQSANDREDEKLTREALIAATAVNRETATAIRDVAQAVKDNTKKVSDHDTDVKKKNDELKGAIEALKTEVKNGYDALAKAMADGIKAGVSEGITSAGGELRAAFQPLIDEMKAREARNVQEDKKRDTGPLGGVDGAAAAAGGTNPASGGAGDGVSDEHDGPAGDGGAARG